MKTPSPVTVDAVANNTATVLLLGGGAILLLLGGYILFEWGAHLLRRVRAKQTTQKNAELLFGLPALAVALIIPGALGFAIRVKLMGIAPDMETGVSIVSFALLVGIIAEGIALITFSRKLKKIAAE